MTLMSNETFAALFNGTGLESVTNRLRVKVQTQSGDGSSSTSVRIEIPPGRLVDEKFVYPTYTVTVSMVGGQHDGVWSVRLVDGDDDHTPAPSVLLEQQFTPERVEAGDAAVDHIVHQGVQLAVPVMFAHLSARLRAALRELGIDYHMDVCP